MGSVVRQTVPRDPEVIVCEEASFMRMVRYGTDDELVDLGGGEAASIAGPSPGSPGPLIRDSTTSGFAPRSTGH